MTTLSTVADMMLDKATVYVAVLLFADFDGDPARFWAGPGLLRTLDGNEWRGGGTLISIDALGPALGTTAQPANVKLSGVAQDIVSRIVANQDVAIERDVIAYAQFFGDGETLDDNAEVAKRFKPVGDPVAIGGWVSDQLSFVKKQGGQTYQVSLSLEGYFVGRMRSPASYYSYTEQNDRAVAMGYSGDQGGEFMASLQNKKINFPDY